MHVCLCVPIRWQSSELLSRGASVYVTRKERKMHKCLGKFTVWSRVASVQPPLCRGQTFHHPAWPPRSALAFQSAALRPAKLGCRHTMVVCALPDSAMHGPLRDCHLGGWEQAAALARPVPGCALSSSSTLICSTRHNMSDGHISR